MNINMFCKVFDILRYISSLHIISLRVFGSSVSEKCCSIERALTIYIYKIFVLLCTFENNLDIKFIFYSPGENLPFTDDEFFLT